MSSRELKLQVVLSALDKITGPLKQITQGSGATAKALRENQAELKRLQAAQGNLKSFQQLRVQATQTNSAMLENQRRLAAVSQEISRATSPTKALLAERDKLTRQTATLTTRYQQERSRMMELTRELKGTDTGTGSLTSRQQQLADRINKATEAVSKHKNALSQLGEMQKRSAALSDQHGKSMRKVAMMGGLGAGGIAVGQRVYSQASRMLTPGVAFGEQMSELQAISRLDKDDDRFVKLSQQARDLGASTAFTAADAAAGQTFLARAGFSPEAIHASMQDMLNLALANKMDLARTADIASNISSAFKIDPEAAGSMQRVGDVLSGVAARTNVNLESLGDTMKYLGGAEDLNISLEQAAAMAGLMGNIGIQGSQAGTAMRAMMNRLTAPAKGGIKAMEAIGLKVADSNGQMRDMPDLLQDIAKATEHMGNVQRKQIMKDIFGTEAGSGMTELVSAMASGDLLPLLNELQNGVTGENAKMANIMADNISGDLKGLVSAWQEVGIAMTVANDGPIRQMVQSITGAVRWIGEWVKENPKLAGTLGKIIGIVAVVATVFGTLAVTAATILGPLSLLRFAFGHLLLNGPMLIGMFKGIGTAVLVMGKLLMANPIFIAIAMLAGAAYMIYRNWDGMVGGFKLMWEGFSAWWSDKAAILGQDWAFLSDAISAHWGEMVGGAKQIWVDLGSFFSNLWSTVTSAFSGGIGSVTALLMDWSPLGVFWQLFQPVLDWFGLDLPAKFSEFGANIINGLVSGITNMAGAAKDAVVGVASNVTGWFKDALGIRSPSRVFAALGGDTVAGLSVGIQANADGPLKRIGELGKKLTAAAGLSIPLLAGAAEPLQFDNRAPLSANRPATAASGGDTITIHVHAAPGMDTAELARLVQQELHKAQLQKQMYNRSRLGDLE